MAERGGDSKHLDAPAASGTGTVALTSSEADPWPWE